MANYSWKSGISGDWMTGADWMGGVPNSASANATIAAGGTYAVDISSGESVTAASVTVNDNGATLQIYGTLNLGGTLNLKAGALFLEGTINGGTINAVDSGLNIASGSYYNNFNYYYEPGTYPVSETLSDITAVRLKRE
jgi:hypothetical protein